MTEMVHTLLFESKAKSRTSMFSVDRTASELRTFAVRGQTLAKPLVFPVSCSMIYVERTPGTTSAGVAEG